MTPQVGRPGTLEWTGEDVLPVVAGSCEAVQQKQGLPDSILTA